MPDTMLEHALEYLERGWSIFPCKPRSKKPLVKWREYQSRKPTTAEIRTWWAKWPRAGIAVVTGATSGLAVVDIDRKSGGTTEGHDITPLMARTPGGTHLFYSTDDSSKAPTGAGFDSPGGKADLRGEGGYIMLPPSGHPSGGRSGAGSNLQCSAGDALDDKGVDRTVDVRLIPLGLEFGQG